MGILESPSLVHTILLLCLQLRNKLHSTGKVQAGGDSGWMARVGSECAGAEEVHAVSSYRGGLKFVRDYCSLSLLNNAAFYLCFMP